MRREKIVFILILMFGYLTLYALTPPDEVNPVIDVPEYPAKFPDGYAALNELVSTNIQYPSNVRKDGIQGRVIVRFVVEKDGKVSDIQIVKTLSPDCDNEAIRLVKQMPAWVPGKQGNRLVRSAVILPIAFKLENTDK